MDKLAAGTIEEIINFKHGLRPSEARFIVENGHVAINGRPITDADTRTFFGDRVWIGRNFYSDGADITIE